MNPFFSVIIPLYNKEDYIVDTLQSVLNQDFSNFEIIVVNDCSTDNSLSVIQQIKDSRIRVLNHPENQGLSATRNTGISVAQGELVGLLDADDLWDPHFLSTMYSLYNSFPGASLFGSDYYEQFSFGKLRTNKTLDKKKDGTSFVVDDFFSSNLGQPIVSQSSLTIKKSVLDEMEFFDSRIKYAEDIDFYIHAFTRYKLAYCYKPLAIYRNDIPSQMTISKISDKQFPDFNSYGKLASKHPSLQKYLDFQRYSFAVNLKMEGEHELAKKLIREINFKNINSKQRFLLSIPVGVLKKIKEFKQYLLKKNIKLSTY